MNQRGHTLLEVVVAVLLLAVALVPVLQLYPSALAAGASQRDLTSLATTAAGKVEELAQALRGGGLGTGTGSQACSTVPGCRVEWSVQPVLASGRAGWLRQVSVVACVDRDGSSSCGPGELQVRYDTRVTSRP